MEKFMNNVTVFFGNTAKTRTIYQDNGKLLVKNNGQLVEVKRLVPTMTYKAI